MLSGGTLYFRVGTQASKTQRDHFKLAHVMRTQNSQQREQVSKSMPDVYNNTISFLHFLPKRDSIQLSS